MFCRATLVGRLGIPRYGDGVEIPFSKREIQLIRQQFGSVDVTYPEMLFWRMLGGYVFRKNRKMKDFFTKLDNFFFKYLYVFNKYSYVQIVSFEK